MHAPVEVRRVQIAKERPSALHCLLTVFVRGAQLRRRELPQLLAEGVEALLAVVVHLRLITASIAISIVCNEKGERTVYRAPWASFGIHVIYSASEKRKFAREALAGLSFSRINFVSTFLKKDNLQQGSCISFLLEIEVTRFQQESRHEVTIVAQLSTRDSSE